MLEINIENNISSPTSNLVKVLSEAMRPFLEEFSKVLKAFADKAPESFRELSKYGWYIDFDIEPGKIVALGESLKNGEKEKVDSYLENYYLENIDNIEQELITNYKDRKEILSEAFRNYHKKHYFSSISLLLTQIDGMCYDNTRKLYFKNNKKLSRKNIYKPEFEEVLRNNSFGLLDVFMSPIEQPSVINEHIGNLEKFPVRLNRHEILHGIDTKYGNHINNLKIISMAKYINDVLKNELE